MLGNFLDRPAGGERGVRAMMYGFAGATRRDMAMRARSVG